MYCLDMSRDEKPNLPSQRQSNLLPDYLDDPTSKNSDEKILHSFIDLKRKTLQSLYGLDKNKDYDHALLMDKSPKGSVDEGIRSLVDLINAHPSYATLSSCSGRISLFDPNHEATISTQNNDFTTQGEQLQEQEQEQEHALETETERTSTGKGYGAWLISSHATITPSQLVAALEDQAKSNSNHALIFKHEPLLLHVAVSNLSRARQLLKIALDLGFRESGTVVTPKRITVAIRSHSLALTVPIASRGRLRPNQEYTEELVREANERFDLNVDKLKRLETMIENTLFTTESDAEERVLDSVDFTVSSIPDLNLWGHTAVAIPINGDTLDKSIDVEIVALGGYGAGPNGKKKTSSRSDKIYSLRRSNGQWDNTWIELKQEKYDTPSEEMRLGGGFEARCTAFSAREGCASCILPQLLITPKNNDSSLVAIFGGRTSPARPNNELLLMSCQPGKATIFTPTDVRGEVPTPRWGHSFTALSGKGGRLAILIGGRSESDVVPSTHVLSCAYESSGDDTNNMFFIWERLPYSIPRFYHGTAHHSTKESTSAEETILVFGGLGSTALVPGITSGKDADDNNGHSACLVVSINDKESTLRECEGKTGSMFGASVCWLSAFNRSDDNALFIASGGLPCDALEEINQSTLEVVKYAKVNSAPSVERLKSAVKHPLGQDINFGSMVHHCCLELPASEKGTAEVALIGGGVPTFAFGQSFAR